MECEPKMLWAISAQVRKKSMADILPQRVPTTPPTLLWHMGKNYIMPQRENTVPKGGRRDQGKMMQVLSTDPREHHNSRQIIWVSI